VIADLIPGLILAASTFVLGLAIGRLTKQD